MSTLSNQVDSLRLMARLVREYDYKEISRMLRKAADTIEALSDKLQGVMGTRYCELFGTPERAARTLQDMCNGSENCKDLRCPALQDTDAQCGNYKLLLGWLKGENE